MAISFKIAAMTIGWFVLFGIGIYWIYCDYLVLMTMRFPSTLVLCMLANIILKFLILFGAVALGMSSSEPQKETKDDSAD